MSNVDTSAPESQERSRSSSACSGGLCVLRERGYRHYGQPARRSGDLWQRRLPSGCYVDVYHYPERSFADRQHPIVEMFTVVGSWQCSALPTVVWCEMSLYNLTTEQLTQHIEAMEEAVDETFQRLRGEYA